PVEAPPRIWGLTVACPTSLRELVRTFAFDDAPAVLYPLATLPPRRQHRSAEALRWPRGGQANAHRQARLPANRASAGRDRDRPEADLVECAAPYRPCIAKCGRRLQRPTRRDPRQCGCPCARPVSRAPKLTRLALTA